MSAEDLKLNEIQKFILYFQDSEKRERGNNPAQKLY